MITTVLIAATLLLVHTALAEYSNVTETCGASPIGPWSSLLEEWATIPHDGHGRQGRILTLPQTNGYYVTDRIDRPSGPPPPRSHYDEWPGMTPPPPPSPGKIVNRPPNPYKDKVKPGYIPGKPTPQQRPPVDRVDEPPPRKEVSETDLYLLGAIEKLVYRVDIMEKRLRKMEESLHYLVAGTDKVPEPCVEGFMRVAGTCYHFSRDEYDWKNANLACRKLKSNLLELEDEKERRQVVAALQTDAAVKGADVWTGGLNPGLLWIWADSARPVLGNATAESVSSPAPAARIYGQGRCLALAYDAALRAYVYRGQDCALRSKFVCEKGEDKRALTNEIERVAKKMRFDAKTRKAKIILADD